jgi:hypothetical protein
MSSPIFTTFKTFYRAVNLPHPGADRSRAENVSDRFLQSPYQSTDPRSRPGQPQTPADGANNQNVSINNIFGYGGP